MLETRNPPSSAVKEILAAFLDAIGTAERVAAAELEAPVTTVAQRTHCEQHQIHVLTPECRQIRTRQQVATAVRAFGRISRARILNTEPVAAAV